MRHRLRYSAATLLTLALLCSCDEEEDYPQFEVNSIAVGEGTTIPKRHTCDGDNISPPFSCSDFPEETKGFAAVMEDTDSELDPFVNWVIWGIPVSFGILNEDQDSNAQGTVMIGVNGGGEWGYDGPCPPDGDEHEFVLKVWALDENILDLREDTDREDLKRRIKKHIVGKGELRFVYER